MAKEKAVKISETKSTELWKVPAYSDSKLVGYTQVNVFKRNDTGLAEAKRTLTLGQLDDLNRQKVTDAKNNLRRGTSVMAALKALVKVNPGLEKIVTLMTEQAAAGKFDAKTMQLIEDSLKGTPSK